MSDGESALMGEVVTLEQLSEAVADSVVDRLSGADSVVDRLDNLEAGLETVSERLDSVQAAVEEATLQAGEIGPVLDEEIGPAVISLIGQLIGALTEEDGESSSDVAAIVSEIRTEVRDVSGVLIHPALTTDFANYTVLEALLLLLVVGKFVQGWIKILGSGFYWLR